MYSEVILTLGATEETAISSQIEAWTTGACHRWKRIVENIRTETALSTNSFVELLRDFHLGLVDGSTPPETAWVNACRRHQFSGPTFIASATICLGRAIPLPDYAALISDSPGIALSTDQCDALIRNVQTRGSVPNSRETRILRRALIGRFVVWATFNDTSMDESPFDYLPKSTEAIRTALGLGECSETETLVLLSYRREGTAVALDLFRPTIAEAANYCWYRPVPDAASVFGWTQPLEPNPGSLSPQPEVVHREMNGESLIFPLYLVV